ncbi:hypothetical protein CP8484711_0753A, partial [Chlamydia psittaci 84-8471/1]
MKPTFKISASSFLVRTKPMYFCE